MGFKLEDLWGSEKWILEFSLGAIFLLALGFTLRFFLSRFQKKAQNGKNRLLFQIDEVAKRPLTVFLWALFVSIGLSLLFHQLQFETGKIWVHGFRDLAVLYCLVWFFLRWKKVVQKTALEKRAHHPSWDIGSIEIIGKLFTVIVIFLAALFSLQIVGMDVAPLIAFGGVGAAVVGIASKDVVANFFGGLMISMTRPFVKGEFVEIPDKSMLGTVEEVGWYYTTLRDLEKRAVYIPNYFSCVNLVINRSRITHWRIDEEIGIMEIGEKAFENILAKLKALLAQHPHIDSKEPIYCFLKKFSEGSIIVTMQAYIKTMHYREFVLIKQEVLCKVRSIIEGEQGKMARPVAYVELSSGGSSSHCK